MFLTIGIASYNYARFLPRAFDAIRRQTFRDFEVLYCDDGSTDDSVAVIEGFIRNNPDMDIRLIKGENLGVMGNKNRILNNAKGKYLMLCDADDWMDDDCLEKLAACAQETDGDRIISGIRHMHLQPDGSYKIGAVEYVSGRPSKWDYFLHHGCLYKTKTYKENGVSFDEKVEPDDVLFVYKLNRYCQKVGFVHDVLYNLYQDGTSVSSTKKSTDPWYFLNLQKNIANEVRTLLPLLPQGDKWELQSCYTRIAYANLTYCTSYSEVRSVLELLKYGASDYLDNPLLFDLNRAICRERTAKLMKIMAELDRRKVLGAALTPFIIKNYLSTKNHV